MGEAKRKALKAQKAVVLDTFGDRLHVEWDLPAAVTPLGQLPFFIEFLKASGLFEAWVADCPLRYASNNAADKRAVLSTFLLSILAGHHRYAHITGFREDSVHPAFRRLGTLVHYLDVGGVQPPETAGVESVLAGLREAIVEDDQLLAAASVFDGLLGTSEKEITAL